MGGFDDIQSALEHFEKLIINCFMGYSELTIVRPPAPSIEAKLSFWSTKKSAMILIERKSHFPIFATFSFSDMVEFVIKILDCFFSTTF